MTPDAINIVSNIDFESVNTSAASLEEGLDFIGDTLGDTAPEEVTRVLGEMREQAQGIRLSEEQVKAIEEVVEFIESDPLDTLAAALKEAEGLMLERKLEAAAEHLARAIEGMLK